MTRSYKKTEVLLGSTYFFGISLAREAKNEDIQAKDNQGNTPLHLAGMVGGLPVVKSLLAVGVDCRVINNQGGHHIHFAVHDRHSAVSKCLLQHFYASIIRRLPLHNIISSPPIRLALDRNVLGTDAAVEILEYLIGRNPALLSSLDLDGSLPLHVACHRGAYSFFR
jgi:hypothetical protein